MRLQRLVDLADQLAFAVAGAQLQAEFLFLGGPVVRVGEVGRLILHVRDGAVDFDHQVALPAVEDAAEVLELLLAHVLLAALDDVRLYIARTGQQAARLERLAVVRLGGGRAAAAWRGGGRDVGGGSPVAGAASSIPVRGAAAGGRWAARRASWRPRHSCAPSADAARAAFRLARGRLARRGPSSHLLALRGLRRRSSWPALITPQIPLRAS